MEIAFENSLNDYAAYNSSKIYPQNVSDLSSDKTYWYSDHTSESTCGNESWTAEIPVRLFLMFFFFRCNKVIRLVILFFLLKACIK